MLSAIAREKSANGRKQTQAPADAEKRYVRNQDTLLVYDIKPAR
jgi:hypothetical protein